MAPGQKEPLPHDARPVTAGELGAAKVRMEQLFVWAFRAFPDVAQKGDRCVISSNFGPSTRSVAVSSGV